MRRSEWILGGILGLVVVAVLFALAFYWFGNQPEESVNLNSNENVTGVEAFQLAQPVAQEWSNDAALMSARASWPPEINFVDGRANWTMIFYSAAESATAIIAVNNGNPQLVRTTPISEELQLGSSDQWLLDSPTAIENLLKIGADEFMTLHAKVNLILVLDTTDRPIWRSTFLDTETKQTYNLNITADTGEFTP